MRSFDTSHTWWRKNRIDVGRHTDGVARGDSSQIIRDEKRIHVGRDRKGVVWGNSTQVIRDGERAEFMVADTHMVEISHKSYVMEKEQSSCWHTHRHIHTRVVVWGHEESYVIEKRKSSCWQTHTRTKVVSKRFEYWTIRKHIQTDLTCPDERTSTRIKEWTGDMTGCYMWNLFWIECSWLLISRKQLRNSGWTKYAREGSICFIRTLHLLRKLWWTKIG